jgi:hypothetical protein
MTERAKGAREVPRLYLYGFVDRPASHPTPPLAVRGVGGGPVRRLYEGAAGAIVGTLTRWPVAVQPDDVLAHENVLEAALAHHTVLPVAFGTVAQGQGEVRSLLRRNAAALEGELRRLAGLEEYSVRVLWRREAVARELGLRVGTALTREHALAVGQAAEAVVARWRERYEAPFLAHFREAARDVRRSASPGVGELWRFAFLVARDRREAFRAAAARAGARFGDRLSLRLAGPLPLHNFVSLRLEGEGEEGKEGA